jgi:hypothetical protein
MTKTLLWLIVSIVLLFLLFYSRVFQTAEKEVISTVSTVIPADDAKKEGFSSNIVPDIEVGQERFNKLMDLVNLTNPALDLTNTTAQAVDRATNTLQVDGGLPGAFRTSGVSTPYKIPTTMPSALNTAQTVCEVVRTTNCAAFQDPAFAANCGISFDIKGIDSRGDGHVGGLYLSPDDRTGQQQRAVSLGLSPDQVQFQPTIGRAKKGQFSADASSCQVISEQIACKKKRNYDTPNCTQCFTSSDWNRVDPNTPIIPPTFVVQTNASDGLFWNNAGVDNPITFTADQPASVSIPNLVEGNTWYFTVKGDPATLYFSGYLTGQTAQGTFNLDLNAIIDMDMVTNYKPRLAGTQSVGQIRCFVFRPAVGQGMMVLRCTLPFSFLAPSEYDARYCTNGPVVKTQAGADYLANDSCYGPKNKPGAYSLDCLQQLWIGMGGTTGGSGYPGAVGSDAVKALLNDAAGNPRSLDDIGNFLYDQNLRASTGRDSTGNQLSIADWSAASIFCTGVAITSPCDGPENNKTSGPLTTDCLQYLYNNSGAGQAIGATYTLGSQYASTNSQGNTVFCRPEGRLSPSTVAGAQRAAAAGGVAAVKALYDGAHRLANDNTQPNSARREALLDCYGTDLQQQNPEVYWVGPGYQYTKDQADGVCAAYGGRVATLAELNAAQAAGGQWCSSGWVADDTDAYYPMQQSGIVGCGGPGINMYTPGTAGVNCIGPKPDKSVVGNTILPFVTLYNIQNSSVSSQPAWYQDDFSI